MSLRALCMLALTAVIGVSAPRAAPAERAPVVDFTPEEVKRILQHGPWPPRWTRDPSNRVSGTPAGIALGERLFFDPRLSSSGTLACATCHRPEQNFADGRKLGVGAEEVDRNTPSVVNVRYNRWFGWDGGNDNLWAQSLRPLLDAREFATTESRLAGFMRADRELACRYRHAFGAAPEPADAERVLVNIGKALAAYQETLVSARAPFDDLRDALARGDRRAAARYPVAAARGLRIFIGKGACSACHFGPNFTNGEFHEIGIPVLRKLGSVDWGRYQGIKMLKASRFNLDGGYSDDAARATAVSTRHVALGPQNYEQFKIPSLRNVAVTAPYMHNGHLATLRDVVTHYSVLDPGLMHQVHLYDSDGVPQTLPVDNLLKPLRLSEAEIDDVVAFLRTLTQMSTETAARRPGKIAACR